MAAQITMRDFEIENLKGQLGIEVTRRREMDRLLEKALAEIVRLEERNQELYTAVTSTPCRHGVLREEGQDGGQAYGLGDCSGEACGLGECCSGEACVLSACTGERAAGSDPTSASSRCTTSSERAASWKSFRAVFCKAFLGRCRGGGCPRRAAWLQGPSQDDPRGGFKASEQPEGFFQKLIAPYRTRLGYNARQPCTSLVLDHTGSSWSVSSEAQSLCFSRRTARIAGLFTNHHPQPRKFLTA